jgi:hypothetical protein
VARGDASASIAYMTHFVAEYGERRIAFFG